MGDDIYRMTNLLDQNYKKPNISNIQIYKDLLSSDETALDYLRIQKNLTDETIKHFNLGYDPLNNRITIPEMKYGELVNIAYRYLDKDAKHKYAKEKGCENWIFNQREGLDIAREKQGILIVSNQFDCISAWQAGFKNVVSIPVGKTAGGAWIELFDSIPRVYICFENNTKSKNLAIDFANRLGTDKCFEVNFPEGIKDCNDYFKSHTSNEFRDILRQAKPYYKYVYQGLDSVIDLIRTKGEKRLELVCLPDVKLHDDWLIIVSGISGVGKTTYVLNLANELIEKEIPTLVVPFERGVKDVGARYLQIRYNYSEDELLTLGSNKWEKIIPEVNEIPLYFSMPDITKIKEVVEKAKKLFGIKVVIIDHLDYATGVSKGKENKVDEMQRVLQEWKSICIENNILFIVVHHIRKAPPGSVTKKPSMEDLKGGSSSFQVSEAVVMLSSPEEGYIEVDVVKNKGKTSTKIYKFNSNTGVIENNVPDILAEEIRQPTLDDF